MSFTDRYFDFRDFFNSVENSGEYNGVKVQKRFMKSSSSHILPGGVQYHCDYHKTELPVSESFYNDIGTIEKDVQIKDIFVEENREFCYYIITPHQHKANKVIFMFHGFNEKSWEKYLLWAERICRDTGSAVVLFPIAFHMQRAPVKWSEKRSMFMLSEQRKKQYKDIANSTLSNVAISMRLQSMPQRFIWSGLQTYYDVIQFIEDCKEGLNDYISPDFTFNIFAYSIGGLLAEILKLSDYKGYFTNTKVCLFCGGAVFNRLSPVSKYILDSEASVALYSYLVEHLSNMLKRDDLLNHYIDGDHVEGKVFHSMLDYNRMRDFREELFRKNEGDIYAISLRQDRVIPSFEIMNTLKGAYRDIAITVDELDFDYSYSHENPFPVGKNSDTVAVQRAFDMVFDRVTGFLG